MRRLAYVVMIALAAGCASPRDNNAPPSDPLADAGGPAQGSGGSAGTGAGGSASGGSSGGFGGAGGSASGGAGGARDAGAGDAAATVDSGSAFCQVSIQPLLPDRFLDLPATPQSRLRVRARVSGPGAPAMPQYNWIVRYVSQPQTVTTVGGDPSTIEFATPYQGAYTISVSVGGACAPAMVTATAIPTTQQREDFLVRITPPTARNLPPQTSSVPVYGEASVDVPIRLDAGDQVTIVARQTDTRLVSAYFVQIRARNGAGFFQGYVRESTNSSGFTARLNPATAYDVVIVPDMSDPTQANKPLAPRLYERLAPPMIRATSFVLDPGTAVNGTISAGTGPLHDARLRLRAPTAPTNVGVANQGAYRLHAGSGIYDVDVIPPRDRMLPEAKLTGLALANGRTDARLDFRYATLPTSRLDLRVTLPGGTPAGRSVRARLESNAGELVDVGTFTLPDGESVPASGTLALELPLDAAGAVSFVGVPRARYTLTLTPEGVAGAATTVLPIDLTGGGVVTRMAALARPGRIVGRLTAVAGGPTPADLTMLALDPKRPNSPPVTTKVASDGRYSLDVDPGRRYVLFVEPDATRNVPRTFVREVETETGDVTVDVTLPRGLSLGGTVLHDGQPVAGAVVQVYCRGDNPGCATTGAPIADSLRPLGEMVTKADGRFSVAVPDPAGR